MHTVNLVQYGVFLNKISLQKLFQPKLKIVNTKGQDNHFVSCNNFS